MGDLVATKPLSPRQREVLALLADGASVDAIASRLSLEPTTVRNHVSAILHRLGCHSQLQAVAAARRQGLV